MQGARAFLEHGEMERLEEDRGENRLGVGYLRDILIVQSAVSGLSQN